MDHQALRAALTTMNSRRAVVKAHLAETIWCQASTVQPSRIFAPQCRRVWSSRIPGEHTADPQRMNAMRRTDTRSKSRTAASARRKARRQVLGLAAEAAADIAGATEG